MRMGILMATGDLPLRLTRLESINRSNVLGGSDSFPSLWPKVLTRESTGVDEGKEPDAFGMRYQG